MANRLATEPSPYLRQHADNPVDWWPWGEAAFARARSEDKPIFLSVGYSTCHWCHVMAHESFEDPAIADVLNREFVPVKVDREERPDVDRVYMTFVQVTTGAGGWPMSVWLTPTLAPFYGGTYFPPTSRWNRPGFLDVLTQIARVWRERRADIEASAASLLDRLRTLGAGEQGGSTVAGADALAAGVAQFRDAFDARRGGFGDAPKFPRPSELLFLLREHARTGAALPLDMVVETLRAMALGGMRDHIGGGFHRYSVDGDWRVPHFEKMLYDQAQLALAYLEAAQATGDQFFAAVADDTLQYVRRDLTDAGGGFYSAEDADSLPPEGGSHPVEGAFYVWRAEDLAERLGVDADVFGRHFGVEADGNAPFDPQGEFHGKNLLYTARSAEDVAATTGRSREEVVASLARARETLLAARAKRPRPHLDDKVLAGWNGLMIAAFARAARVLVPGAFESTPGQARAHLAAARRAAEFVRAHLWDASEQRLARRYRDGASGIDAYADDYAYLIFGLLELFQAVGDTEWLAWARELQQAMDRRFWDDTEGGWFSTTGDDPSVLVRQKEDYDGAEPAPSSIAVLNLLTFSHLSPDPELERRIERTFERHGARLGAAARVVPMMMAALSHWHAGVGQVVLAGTPGEPTMEAFKAVLASRYRPFLIVVPSGDPNLEKVLPFTADMQPRDAHATAYLCRNFHCEAPITEPVALAAALDTIDDAGRGDESTS